MKIEQWIRKPVPINVVRVTSENLAEVAKWCKSLVNQTGSSPWIDVRFKNPQAERRRKAYVGDYILELGSGTQTSYKIYTAAAFHAAFDPAPVVHYDEEAFYGLVKKATGH